MYVHVCVCVCVCVAVGPLPTVVKDNTEGECVHVMCVCLQCSIVWTQTMPRGQSQWLWYRMTRARDKQVCVCVCVGGEHSHTPLAPLAHSTCTLHSTSLFFSAAVKRSPSSTGSEVSRDSSTGAKAGRRREEEREAEAAAGDYRYATLSRVRKFEVDGRVMQTTTKRIVEVKSNQTLKDSRKLQQMRKADSHEMKRLQREEMKEAVVFYDKIKAEREVQERKIEIELQVSFPPLTHPTL